MPYTTAQKTYAARLLCAQFPRLHFGVARTWVTAEAGADNNVFGVTVGGVLQKYPSVAAGVRAAADRLRSLDIYRGVIEAFNAPHTQSSGCPPYGSHASRQATAICRSPWNTGVAGLKAQGGISRYYARIFRDAGFRVA